MNTANDHPDGLLSPDDVATILGVPKATLYRWRTGRVGPPAARIGRHLRYPQDALRDWIDAQVGWVDL